MLRLLTPMTKPTSTSPGSERALVPPTSNQATPQQNKPSAGLASADLGIFFPSMAPKVQFHPLNFKNSTMSSQPPPTVMSSAKPPSTLPTFSFTQDLRFVFPDDRTIWSPTKKPRITSTTLPAPTVTDGPKRTSVGSTPSTSPQCEYMSGDRWHACSTISAPDETSAITSSPSLTSSPWIVLSSPTTADTTISVSSTETSVPSRSTLDETVFSSTSTKEVSSYSTIVTTTCSPSASAASTSTFAPAPTPKHHETVDPRVKTTSRTAIGIGVGLGIIFIAVVVWAACMMWARRKKKRTGALDVEASKASRAAEGRRGGAGKISAPYEFRRVRNPDDELLRSDDELSVILEEGEGSSLPSLPLSVESIAQSFTIPRKPLPANSVLLLGRSRSDLDLKLARLAESQGGKPKSRRSISSGTIISGIQKGEGQDSGKEVEEDDPKKVGVGVEDGGDKELENHDKKEGNVEGKEHGDQQVEGKEHGKGEEQDSKQVENSGSKPAVAGGEDDGTSMVSARDEGAGANKEAFHTPPVADHATTNRVSRANGFEFGFEKEG